MARVSVDSNIKGEIGEAAILGNRKIPDPVEEDLLDFLSGVSPLGENPNTWTRVRRNVYFNATNEDGEKLVWQADGRITLNWASPDAQEASQDEFPRTDMKAVFPVDVKTGEYAELERRQLEVARTIAQSPNNVFPAVLSVSVENLPDSFDVTTKIYGEDFS